jgi:hypothetical protein
VPGLFAKAQPRSVPLAWRNLVANKQRLLRSAAGIGFAVLLMLMQLGFEQAFFDSALTSDPWARRRYFNSERPQVSVCDARPLPDG